MPPTTAQTAPARSAPGLTRQDLLGLGRAGKPRDFIPLAVQAIAQIPADHDLRFLLAANCARLGLRALAAEALAELPESAQADANVQTLAGAVASLPDDRVSPAERRATAEANLAVLRERALPAARVLEEAWPAWLDRLDRHECFRTTDSNLVRRSTHGDLPAWPAFLLDHRAVARQFCAQKLDSTALFPPPLAIEGLDPPWLAEGVWRALPPSRVGYAAPITLLQADPFEFLDGLAAADLREMLADERVRVFVGPDASSAWFADAMSRLDEAALGMAIAVPGTRARIRPDAQSVTNRWSAAQTEALREVQTRVTNLYTPRDRAWWAKRYHETNAGGPPLRVLIPTSRYSTFIKHASEDLAEALRTLGCEARVCMEPPNSRPTPLGQLHWIEDFEPDLIVLANYFRHDAGLPFPEQVPWVCWLQDTMEHQFAERRFSELDFVVGHLHTDLRNKDSFPKQRAMSFPVVASAEKFHAAPFDDSLWKRFACEIAYVSHQSETPEAFHARCAAEAKDPTLCRLIDTLRPEVEREACDPLGISLHRRLRDLTAGTASQLAPDTDTLATYALRHYAIPLADRVLRQQTLAWAANLCDRHGWTLRVFGRGWEDHPRFAEFACGEVSHEEELRACYQAATVHLHVSVNTLVHQRVMECAMSGGLPVGRLTIDAVHDMLGHAKREATLHDTPCEIEPETGTHHYRVADCPSLREAAALRGWLGLPSPEVQTILASQVKSFRRPDHPSAGGMHAAWLFGNLSELTVRSEADLERLVTRAISDPQWRAAQSAGIAERVRERCSTEVFARRVLGMVRGSLDAPHAPTEDARP